MKKLNILTLIYTLLITFSVFSLTSCQAIGDIFKAGMWFGVIGVVLVVVLIVWIIGKAGGR
jgi:hypothetical protein